MLTGLFILYVVLFAAKNLPPQEPAPWSERIDGLKKIQLGPVFTDPHHRGIYTGAFTPTEAAAVGVVYSLFITFCVYKTLTWRDMSGILLETVRSNAMILAIIVGAMLFGFVLTILAPAAGTYGICHQF